MFAKQYTMIHRLETNKLRNVAKLFAHLIHSDAIPWGIMVRSACPPPSTSPTRRRRTSPRRRPTAYCK